MTPEAIARRTNVPIEIVLQGLAQLQSPDPNSRSLEEDGRRIQLIDPRRKWGWKIVNYCKYREVKSELDRSRLITTNGEQHYGGYVYFMSLVGDESKVKIGYSINPWARLNELATGAPHGVVMIGWIKGGPDTESSWHEKFAKDRLNGEWFSLTPELKSEIESVVDPSLRKVMTRSYGSNRSSMQKQKQKQKQKQVPPYPQRGIVDEIYAAYPKKVGKRYAVKCIQAAIDRGNDATMLLAKTSEYATVIKGTDTILPHPSTWFNQDRFNDEPSTWVRQHLNGDHANLEKKLEAKTSRMAELKRRHYSETQSVIGGKYLPPGWRDAKAKEEYFRLKTETETINQQLSKA